MANVTTGYQEVSFPEMCRRKIILSLLLGQLVSYLFAQQSDYLPQPSIFNRPLVSTPSRFTLSDMHGSSNGLEWIVRVDRNNVQAYGNALNMDNARQIDPLIPLRVLAFENNRLKLYNRRNDDTVGWVGMGDLLLWNSPIFNSNEESAILACFKNHSSQFLDLLPIPERSAENSHLIAYLLKQESDRLLVSYSRGHYRNAFWISSNNVSFIETRQGLSKSVENLQVTRGINSEIITLNNSNFIASGFFLINEGTEMLFLNGGQIARGRILQSQFNVKEVFLSTYEIREILSRIDVLLSAEDSDSLQDIMMQQSAYLQILDLYGYLNSLLFEFEILPLEQNIQLSQIHRLGKESLNVFQQNLRKIKNDLNSILRTSSVNKKITLYRQEEEKYLWIDPSIMDFSKLQLIPTQHQLDSLFFRENSENLNLVVFYKDRINNRLLDEYKQVINGNNLFIYPCKDSSSDACHNRSFDLFSKDYPFNPNSVSTGISALYGIKHLVREHLIYTDHKSLKKLNIYYFLPSEDSSKLDRQRMEQRMIIDLVLEIDRNISVQDFNVHLISKGLKSDMIELELRRGSKNRLKVYSPND